MYSRKVRITRVTVHQDQRYRIGEEHVLPAEVADLFVRAELAVYVDDTPAAPAVTASAASQVIAAREVKPDAQDASRARPDAPPAGPTAEASLACSADECRDRKPFRTAAALEAHRAKHHRNR